MTIIDTHAHIDHLDHVEQALVAADQAKVDSIIAVAMDLASCKKSLEIKQSIQRPRLYLAFGTHPSEVNPNQTAECLQFIREHAQEIVAIGEIGLDFWYKWVRKDKDKHREQREAFRSYLELAKELDLPAIIHSRGTWKECLETTQEIGLKKAVFHWYSGPVNVLEEIVASGYYVSTTPSLAYSPQSREAMAQAPIENTLIETDSPVTFKDGDNSFKAEPKDVWRTLKIYSEFKNIPLDEAAEILNSNAKEFFNIQ